MKKLFLSVGLSLREIGAGLKNDPKSADLGNSEIIINDQLFKKQ